MAVAEAYGWPVNLSDQDILVRLVALNRQRRQEEISGKIRWLRPDFQTGRAAVTGKREIDMDLEQGEAVAMLQPWPKTLAEQVQAVRAALARLGPQPSVEAIAKQFRGARRDRVAEILQVMAVMG